MKKIINLTLVAMLLLLAATPALARATKAGMPDQYGAVFFDRDESGKKYYSHAEWITEFGKPELRLASDLVPRKEPLVSAAVIDGREYAGLEDMRIDEIEFTYRKNRENEADPVLRIMREDDSMQTINVQNMKRQPSPGNFTIAGYQVPEGSKVKVIAILAQAHRKNNDGCNFEIINVRYKTHDNVWHVSNKDLKVRELEPGCNGALDKIFANLYR